MHHLGYSPIEGESPSNWSLLELHAARVLAEAGFIAEKGVRLKLSRGVVNVDVYATDPKTAPPSRILVECKKWKNRVPKNVVHSFRQVVSDAGANHGIIISTAGFQLGAIEAARYSNVSLLGWAEFEAMFVERWYENYFIPELRSKSEPLLDYVDYPIGNRVYRKAEKLDPIAVDKFKALRLKHLPLGDLALNIVWGRPYHKSSKTGLDLPFRTRLEGEVQGYSRMRELPSSILDAEVYRLFLEAVLVRIKEATDEFNELFGESI